MDLYEHLSTDTRAAILEAEGASRVAYEHKLDVYGDIVEELLEVIEEKNAYIETLHTELSQAYDTVEIVRAELRVMKAKYYSQPIITEDAGHGIPAIDFVLIAGPHG